MDAVNILFNFTFIQPRLLIINICEFGLGNFFVCLFFVLKRTEHSLFLWPSEHCQAKMDEALVDKHPSFFISWRVFYTPVTQTLLHVRSSREYKKFLVPKPHPRPIKFMSLLEDSGTCVFQSSQVIVMFSQVVNLQSTRLPEFSISSEVQCPVL